MMTHHTAPNVLSLSHEEAMNYFMKSAQYQGFELPEYFAFDEVLSYVRTAVGNKPYESFVRHGFSPETEPDVNLNILLNKDGRYAVRPIVLANPFLYYFLVRELCNEQSWTEVKQLFEKFSVPHIASCALPVLPKEKESFHHSTTILNWWNSIEQRSIELSLEYRYMFVTDITNCYGSVNPQSFEWAFTLRDTPFATKGESSIAKNIRAYLRAMQQGRNIGIPQGSAIFDFVAEIILGYADLLLHEELKKQHISDYEIIRYRDDYRIFCNNKDVLEKISYTLQHVLERLNFRMNSGKTSITDSVVLDSIKPDKLDYIANTPIFSKKGCDFDSFEKHLLFILIFARKHRNSGTIKTLLSDIDRRVAQWIEADEQKPKHKATYFFINEYGKLGMDIQEYELGLPGGSIRAMAAVCTQIAIENVRCAHYALRVLSRMVNTLNDETEKWDIINKVYAKLSAQPNSTYYQLWLQNITYQKDKSTNESPYDFPLCQLVAGKSIRSLWNNRWLNETLAQNLPVASIVDQETLQKVTPVITFRETRNYYDPSPTTE